MSSARFSHGNEKKGRHKIIGLVFPADKTKEGVSVHSGQQAPLFGPA